MRKLKRSQKSAIQMIMGIAAGIMIGLVSLSLAFALPAHSDYDNASQATAEHLVQYPAQMPNFLQIDENCTETAIHCIRILPDQFTSPISVDNMSITVSMDGQVQDDFQWLMDADNLYADFAFSDLGAGLHLIELRIRVDNGQHFYHAWSFNNDSGLVSAPPTLAVPPTYSTAVPDNE